MFLVELSTQRTAPKTGKIILLAQLAYFSLHVNPQSQGELEETQSLSFSA